MHNTLKYIILLTAALLIDGGNSYAVGPDEEAILLARRIQTIQSFVHSREALLQELNHIETLEGDEKLKKLREFGYKNLNVEKSIPKISRMREIFFHFVKDPDLTWDKGTSLEQKIRHAMAEDLNDLINEAPPAHLPGGSFPIGYWQPHQNIQPTTEVQITHGGGLNYLLNCFEEKEIGYRLQQGGAGIQVLPRGADFNNPVEQLRPASYAYYAMINSLDFPAVLTGTIQAQYLMPGNEADKAAISVSDLKHIKNARLTLVTSDIMKNTLGNAYEKHTEEFYKLLPQDLLARFNAFNAEHYVEPQLDLFPNVPALPPVSMTDPQPAPLPDTPPSTTAPQPTPKKATARQRTMKQKAPRKAARTAISRQRVAKQKRVRIPTKKVLSRERVSKQSTPRKGVRKTIARQRMGKQKRG